MRKWNDPPPHSDVPPIVAPPEGEKVRLRARAFRRWIAGGAEPGGLRALAGEHVRDEDERPPTDGPR